MKNRFLILIVLFNSFFFMSCSDKKNESDKNVNNNSRFDYFIETLEKDLAESDAYGVSVAVMENGKVSFKTALGSKDSEGEESLTPDTLMQIGSITKNMTATALLQKIEKGMVGINDDFEKLLPDIEFKVGKERGKEITVHHLLTHQGGFYDWSEWDDNPDDKMLYYGGLAYAEKYFLMNPPGIFWNYSNPNFSYVGIITEKLDSRFWPDIMTEDIFLPLGMTRTYLCKKEVKKDGNYSQSYGYRIDDLESGNKGPVEMEMIADSAFTRPVGLVWTTPSQMMKWAEFIMEGNSTVLSDQLRTEITKPQIDTLHGDEISYYGYGMMVEKGYMSEDGNWYEMDVWRHNGATLSFTSDFYMLPEHKFAVSIISSGYYADFSKSMDAAITSLATLPEPSSDPPEFTVDYDKFDEHTGYYNDPNNVGTMIVTKKDNKLLVSAPTLDKYDYSVSPELEPVTGSMFLLYLDGEPLDITFIKDEKSDKSIYMRNRMFVLTRTESPEEITMTPSEKRVRKFVTDSKTFPDINTRKFIQKVKNFRKLKKIRTD